MPLHLQIRHKQGAGWELTGLPRHRVVEFNDLATGLDYAKRECDSAPAIIELFSDGIYVAVSQEEGWPHCRCHSALPRRPSPGDRPSSLFRLGDLVKRCAGCQVVPSRASPGS